MILKYKITNFFKLKIAINFENLPKDGGAFHENILLTEVFKAFKGTKYKIPPPRESSIMKDLSKKARFLEDSFVSR